MRTFIITLTTGEAWIPGRASHEQPLWDEHAAYIDLLYAFGHIVRGGPEIGHTGLQLIVQAHSAEAVVDLLLDDPWLRAGLLQPPVIKESSAILSVPSAI
ncbi:MAG: hypothetical protein IT320_04395 [Anaerolineae bacterium]|nr:hypothetical protein [Anaerolineae bacterium]